MYTFLSTRNQGIFEALLSATFFGLIPTLFLPIHSAGISPEVNVIYRFVFASLIMFFLVKIKKQSFRIELKTHASIALTSFAYYIAALFLYSSFTFIPSGITITLFFTNPIFVMFLMALFYREKIEMYKIFLCITTLLGIALFSNVFSLDITLNTKGLLCALTASLSYAFYILSLFRLQSRECSKELVSFYLFFYCSILSIIYTLFNNTFFLPTSPSILFFLFLSGLFTAVLPNVLLISAMKKIGSVLSAILGVMEPITAVLIGVLVFNEAMNFTIFSGIIIVLISVLLIAVLPMLRK